MTAIFNWIDALPAWVLIASYAIAAALLLIVIRRRKRKSPGPVGAEDGAKENSHNHDIRK